MRPRLRQHRHALVHPMRQPVDAEAPGQDDVRRLVGSTPTNRFGSSQWTSMRRDRPGRRWLRWSSGRPPAAAGASPGCSPRRWRTGRRRTGLHAGAGSPNHLSQAAARDASTRRGPFQRLHGSRYGRCGSWPSRPPPIRRPAGAAYGGFRRRAGRLWRRDWGGILCDEDRAEEREGEDESIRGRITSASVPAGGGAALPFLF